jgi:hypothetical protein
MIVALATMVGAVAGYGAAKLYPRPFEMAAAAEPKIRAAPAQAPAIMPAQLPSATMMPIPVVKPRTQSVSSYVEITGNAASVNAVKLIARVEGYLDKIHYEDGQFARRATSCLRFSKTSTKISCSRLRPSCSPHRPL